MKSLILLAFTLLIASSLANFVDQHGALRTQGNRIVDQNGQQVRLTGMSLFWSQWAGDWWNPNAIKWLVDNWHITLIRAPLAVNRGGYVDGDSQGELNKMMTVVDACIANGIYVVVDWHAENEDAHIDRAKEFFGIIAQKYGNVPNVMYEPFNEPGPGNWWSVKWYHEAIIPVIRQHSQNLIIAGTSTWSQDVDQAAQDPLGDHNTAYTLHFYCDVHRDDIRNKANQALQRGIALFVTEWGVCANWVDQGSAWAWRNWMEQNSISSANWSLNDKPECESALNPGANRNGPFDNLTQSGQFAHDFIMSSPHAIMMKALKKEYGMTRMMKRPW